MALLPELDVPVVATATAVVAVVAAAFVAVAAAAVAEVVVAAVAAVVAAAVVAAAVAAVVAAVVEEAAVVVVDWLPLALVVGVVLFEDPLEQAARASAAASASGAMNCRARTDGGENIGRRIVNPLDPFTQKVECVVDQEMIGTNTALVQSHLGYERAFLAQYRHKLAYVQRQAMNSSQPGTSLAFIIGRSSLASDVSKTVPKRSTRKIAARGTPAASSSP